MKLSEIFKKYDSCGDFGRSLQGLSEMADALEIRLDNIESQLADALAVIAEKNNSLRNIIEWHTSSKSVFNTAKAALAIKPGDVTLVEVGKVHEVGGSLFASQYSPNNGVKVGDIVYTIKTKD